MKNTELWRPTKFVKYGDRLRASRDPAHVSISSRFAVDTMAPYYQRALRAHAKGRLLDVGCGNVPLYETYRDLVSENVCIDWENSLHPNPYIDQMVNLTGSLPLPAESFDTVLFTDVLEHIPEPLNLVRELARLLRPSGKMIIGVPFLYCLHEMPHDYYRYTESALRRFAELAGLRVLELEPYGGLPEVLLDLSSKALNYLPRWLRPIHSTAIFLSRTSPGRRLSQRTVSTFPLGYVLVGGRDAVIHERNRSAD